MKRFFFLLPLLFCSLKSQAVTQPYTPISVLPINVKNNPYNAKGDGVTNDFSAINTAENVGQAVYLSSGIYLISSSLTGKILYGDPGSLVTLHPTLGISLSSHSYFRDLTITQNGVNPFTTNRPNIFDVNLEHVKINTDSYAIVLSSNSLTDVAFKDGTIIATGYGFLANQNSNGGNFKVFDSSITSLTADAVNINQPSTGGVSNGSSGFIISRNFLSTKGSTSVFTGGFDVAIAGIDGGVISQNVSSDSSLEAVHLEDMQKNVVVGPNVWKTRRDGFRVQNFAGNGPPIIDGNQFTSLLSGQNFGGYLFSDGNGTVNGASIVNNHFLGFNTGLYFGSIGSGQTSVITYAAGNSIEKSTNAVSAAGNGGTGETRQFGVNISSNCLNLFSPSSAHYSFGKVYSATIPNNIISSTTYSGFMPSAYDGFGAPLTSIVLSSSAVAQTAFTLTDTSGGFRALANNRFWGRVRVQTIFTGTANWCYTGATLKWDGTALTVSDQISRFNGNISTGTPTFAVSGGALQVSLIISNGAVNLNDNYFTFDGEFWDQ